MDTLSIYEQFRAGLGEEKAKGFAQPETMAYAREQGVRIWADGVLIAERP